MSFDIALSGIQAINEQLDTVSNNIANSGTYGFKSSRSNFSSLVAGDTPNGVQVGSTTQNIEKSGGVQTTGRPMDAMIQGRGFFVAKDAQGQLNYTRVGIFTVNKDGFVVDSSNRKVQGYAAVKVGGALGVMGDLTVPTGQIPAVATSKISYVGNLSADWVPPTATFNSSDPTSYNMVKQSVVYDTLGKQHTVSQYFVKGAGNTVDVYYANDGAYIAAALPPAPPPPAVPPPPPLVVAPTTLTFNASGALTAPAPAKVALSLTDPAAGTVNFSIDYTGTTQFAGQALTTTNASDGYASGNFVGVELGEDGSVIAKYSNEQQQVVGMLSIATFPDEGALSQISDTSWVANEKSGAALYERPGVGLAGKLSTGTLEGSNVDVTAELVGLMTSQRNYQANSKVISTESAMMQALMQAM
jgi:flagellar hook protein FlgE